MANSISNLWGRLLKRDSDSPVEGNGIDAQPSADDARQDSRTPVNTPARIEWFDENGVCRSEPVVICDLSTHGLSFTVNEEFPVDHTLWIETDGNPITKTVVRHSKSKGRGYITGAYRVSQERRRTDRLPVSGQATLHWGDSQVGPCDAPVIVRNATEYGLQLECSMPLPDGTIVQLRGDELQCDGSTCYCRESGDKFVVGVHLVRQAYAKNALEFKGD